MYHPQHCFFFALWCFVCLASGVYRDIVVGGDEAKIRQRFRPTKYGWQLTTWWFWRFPRNNIIEQLHKPQPHKSLSSNCNWRQTANARGMVWDMLRPIPFSSPGRRLQLGDKMWNLGDMRLSDVISLQENVWDGKKRVLSGLVLGKTAW